jgi:two-component system sensor histidine kinase CpxA
VIARVRRSLGAQILLLAGVNLLLLAIIALAASGVRVPRSAGQMIMQSADPRLQDVARRIALDVERGLPDQAQAILDRYGAEYRAQFVLVRNDGTRIAGANLALPGPVIQALAGPPPPKRGPPPPGGRPFPGGPQDRLGPPDRESGLRMPQTPAQLIRVEGRPRNWIILRTPIRFAGQPEIVPGSLVIVPDGLIGNSLLFPLHWLWWTLLAAAVTAACWFPFLRGVTSSLGRMAHATDRVAHGRFDTTIDVRRPDELGRLSASIESMAGRLGALVSGQKRFLGDTAHELRSPLGRMQVALEILDQRVGDAERAYLVDLKEDVAALTTLTDELLQYARAELKERGAARQSVALRPVVERVIAKEGNGATIAVDVPGDVTVRGDAQLLERAIANVIRNAVKYAGTAGPISVAATNEHGAVMLSVADCGPGVGPESLDRLFDPFFREDAARNRKTGGTGLGLAIVRSAVEACGGSVSCANRLPHGLELRMVLESAATT